MMNCAFGTPTAKIQFTCRGHLPCFGENCLKLGGD